MNYKTGMLKTIRLIDDLACKKLVNGLITDCVRIKTLYRYYGSCGIN